jgi:hypothetical protein
LASHKSKKSQREQDVYNSFPQEQRPTNLPPEDSEMAIVGDQAEQGQTSGKRRKNNPNNFFVKKHGKS